MDFCPTIGVLEKLGRQIPILCLYALWVVWWGLALIGALLEPFKHVIVRLFLSHYPY